MINASFSIVPNDEFVVIVANVGVETNFARWGDAPHRAGEGTPSGEKDHARRVACGNAPTAKTTSPTFNTRQEVGETKRQRLYGEGHHDRQSVRRPKALGYFGLIHMLRNIYQPAGPHGRRYHSGYLWLVEVPQYVYPPQKQST